MPGLSRTPEVTELRSFCAAADLGSIGRAAIRLNVSQPALSKRLQALEQLAGVALLERSPRGVTLTPAGRHLYAEARRLIEQAEIVEGLMAGLGRTSGPLRIAASHSAGEAIVDRRAQPRDEHPLRRAADREQPRRPSARGRRSR